MKKALYFLAVIALVFSAGACEDDTPQSEIDAEIIQKYIEEHNLDAELISHGVYGVILDEGKGDKPNYYSKIKVNYTGYLTDGTVFDSGTLTDQPLSGLISGWQVCIPKLGQGGSGTFIIPSGMGYGRTAAGSIPANSVLVFDITLIDFY